MECGGSLAWLLPPTRAEVGSNIIQYSGHGPLSTVSDSQTAPHYRGLTTFLNFSRPSGYYRGIRQNSALNLFDDSSGVHPPTPKANDAYSSLPSPLLPPFPSLPFPLDGPG